MARPQFTASLTTLKRGRPYTIQSSGLRGDSQPEGTYLSHVDRANSTSCQTSKRSRAIYSCFVLYCRFWILNDYRPTFWIVTFSEEHETIFTQQHCINLPRSTQGSIPFRWTAVAAGAPSDTDHIPIKILNNFSSMVSTNRFGSCLTKNAAMLRTEVLHWNLKCSGFRNFFVTAPFSLSEQFPVAPLIGIISQISFWLRKMTIIKLIALLSFLVTIYHYLLPSTLSLSTWNISVKSNLAGLLHHISKPMWDLDFPPLNNRLRRDLYQLHLVFKLSQLRQKLGIASLILCVSGVSWKEKKIGKKKLDSTQFLPILTRFCTYTCKQMGIKIF
ncbi:hypothetical protein VP01_2259g1 [Puccinia sorghi]|uniref:Uncharacterized protein n=1 Tax=Puccinia sorghi TaxID=27349 RepID=A0A0L6V8I8_9BASI|nr:hypothetical protein VP01_2259g1 [Puccinia sorghi]